MLIVSFPVHGTAQTVTGTIQGVVTDSSGAVLPGASVTTKNLETGATRTVTSNDVGFYGAPFLPSAATRSPPR